jgi:hypothetical protein
MQCHSVHETMCLWQCFSAAGPWHQLYRDLVLQKKNLPGHSFTQVENHSDNVYILGHGSLKYEYILLTSSDTIEHIT